MSFAFASSRCQTSSFKNGETIGQVCINDYLHDYCLLDLFDYLTLSELVRIDQVCARWKALRWSALCRRRKLTLVTKYYPYNIVQEHGRFAIPHSDKLRNAIPEWESLLPIDNEDDSPTPIDDDLNTSIQWSQLKLREITFDTTKWLFENLRNINSLTICLSGLEWIQPKYVPFNTEVLKWLLDKWSSNLLSLKLYSGKIDIYPIYECINAMKVLRHFTLVVHDSLQLKSSANLQILSQLEEFYIFSYDMTSLILDQLKDNAFDNYRLKRIGVGVDWNTDTMPVRHNETVGSLLSLDRNLAASFVYLEGLYTIPSHQMYLFCNKFSSLESITLKIEAGQSYARLLNCLAQLKQLIYLQLKINRNYKIAQFVHNEDKQYEDKLAKLYSVKIFHLTASFESHKEILQIKLNRTFPNVQVVLIDKNRIGRRKGCSICRGAYNCAKLLADTIEWGYLCHTTYIYDFEIELIWPYRRYY